MILVSWHSIIREKKLYILELFCLIFAVIGYIKMFSDGSNDDFVTGASYVLFSFLVRNLRISYLLSEVKAFKVIMDMIMKMTIPIMYMLACLYIVYYVFALIGMFGLSGEIKVPRFHGEDGIPNNLYYLVNFNDLGSSMVTLYAFMIINNWPAITDTLVNAAGGDVWPRIYFMVFYIIVQWIILNLVIAMMLEIYTNVESENDIELQRKKNVVKLMGMQKELGNRRFEDYCDEVNEAILKEEVDKSELLKRT